MSIKVKKEGNIVRDTKITVTMLLQPSWLIKTKSRKIRLSPGKNMENRDKSE